MITSWMYNLFSLPANVPLYSFISAAGMQSICHILEYAYHMTNAGINIGTDPDVT
jgi:hypothetical protein